MSVFQVLPVVLKLLQIFEKVCFQISTQKMKIKKVALVKEEAHYYKMIAVGI
jgi:hypothetical protein